MNPPSYGRIRPKIAYFCLWMLLSHGGVPALQAQSGSVEPTVDLTAYSRAFSVKNLVFQTPAAFRIVIVEAGGAIDNISLRTAREPIVQIVDQNNNPIGGVSVTFVLPDVGPSGVFANGSTSLTVVTDDTGRAVAEGFTKNNLEGPYDMQVNATAQGQTVSTSVAQANALGAAVGGGIGGGTIAAIVGAVVGAVVVGAVTLTNDDPTPPTTLELGLPTVGAPQ